MSSFYIERQNFVKFLKSLSKEYSVYLPHKTSDENFAFKLFEPGEIDYVDNSNKTIEPLKTFFTSLREKVAGFPKNFPLEPEKPLTIVGVTSCDLFALKIQDYVFKEGNFSDSLYALRRNNAILISSDCTLFKEVCFCLALEIFPYPTEGFDLNLSPLSDGFAIKVGSPRGGELIRKNKNIFREANDKELAEIQANREKLVKKLRKHLQPKEIPSKEKLQKVVKRGLSSNLWAEEAEKCVECGACNFICGTCHCFLLFESKGKEEFKKMRCWDSCQYQNFARVAGGANPLKTRPERLRNRFLKKFDFFPENIGFQACCGCGRCIEACPAEIDIREILNKLSTSK